MPIERRQFMATLATAAIPLSGQPSNDITRPWLGRQYWSNPLQDWRLHDGRMECIVAGGDRNVALLTREIAPRSGDFRMSVRVGRLEMDRANGPAEGFAGFRVGARGHFNDYRDTAVRGIGLDIGVSGTDGRLFIGELTGAAPAVQEEVDELVMVLQARPSGNLYTLDFEVADPNGRSLAKLQRSDIQPEWLTGGIALVCSSGAILSTPHPLHPMVPNGGAKGGTQRGGGIRCWFRDWQVSGSKVDIHEDRAWGPILFALHTLSRGVLKITAQMAAVENDAQPARLEIRKPGSTAWTQVASSPLDPLSHTATFRVVGWDDTRNVPYRIAFSHDNRDHVYEGTIRRDPKDKQKLVIGALTCNNDFGFPHEDIIRGLKHFSPDLLLFTGDQIYERVCEYGIQMDPLDAALLDYHRKWILFGWSYRDLLRDTPTVTMPDDHDMYHGNIWGAGGKRAEPPTGLTGADRNKGWQDDGGYKMPAAWVNAVQRTQTSHLPDPFDPSPITQDIGVYYTSMLYGGVSFAILEDRKWKSSPAQAIPWAKIENGWAKNPKYDASKDGDVKGAELLGARQLTFLEKWASDSSGDPILKIVVSQTIFCNLATLPPPANNDDVTPKLPVLPVGAHPQGEIKVQDHDSNGWPQTPRNLALRVMRKAVKLHIGGDQHLGSTLRYGIDDWNDGPYAFCTPAISNLWPRRWYPPEDGKNRKPGSPRYTGEFVDGFGNRMTVLAVANPAQFGVNPSELYDRAPGYGIVEIERKTSRITLANWPRWVDPSMPDAKPYAGWPITI